MEPVSTIFKLLQEIAKAERTARRNRTRCRELARRAQAVADVLRDSKAGARGDAAGTRRNILCRLKEALDDALKLVESCRQSDGLLFCLPRLLTSGAKADRFDEVDKRITNCLIDLNTASGACMEKKINQLAFRDLPRTNKSKQINAPQIDAVKNDKNRGFNKGGQSGAKGSKRRRRKKAAAARPPPPLAHAGVPCYPNGDGYAVYHHSIEEDPNSCSVM